MKIPDPSRVGFGGVRVKNFRWNKFEPRCAEKPTKDIFQKKVFFVLSQVAQTTDLQGFQTLFVQTRPSSNRRFFADCIFWIQERGKTKTKHT